MDNQTGIYGKYIISKADGSPVDPDADYFVLRLDGNSVYAEASRMAAKAYAETIKAVNPTLAAELLSNADYAHSTAYGNNIDGNPFLVDWDEFEQRDFRD